MSACCLIVFLFIGKLSGFLQLDNNKLMLVYKGYLLFFTNLISILSFFCLFSIYLFWYNYMYISVTVSTSSVFFYTPIIIFNLFGNSLLLFSITKFNVLFFALFSLLYPIIIILMGIDFNINQAKLYVYMYLVFVISYMLLAAENIILFYFLYEIVLILVFGLMYLSSNSRGGIEASLFYAGWAILGSILVGIGFILLVLLTGEVLFINLVKNKLTSNEVYYIYMLLFFGFGTKLSTWPFWYWLPRAHVEVSTGVSVFLSCILIKLSFFCLFRCQFVLSSEISLNICLIVTFLSVIDIVFRFFNLRDLKAIIAYSSVLHTNLLLSLVHLDNFKIVNSSIIYVWGHSLATATLFISVNLIEMRYGSRNIMQVSGLWYTSPSIAYLVLWSILSFIDLPVTIFFWGELWLWTILFNALPVLSIQIIFLVNVFFISMFFKIWWGVLFGVPNISVKKLNLNEYRELYFVQLSLLILQFILAIQPSILTSFAGYII